MKPFTKSELKITILIFMVVFIITGINMNTSLRRARDAQRRSDLGAITNAVEKFHSEFRFYPPSDDGKIKICKGESFDKMIEIIKSQEVFDRNFFFSGMRGCIWGQESLADPLDETYTPYMKNIPADPKFEKGNSYLYLSNSNRFQVYAYLEGDEDEIGYDQGIVARSLVCGRNICNFGKSLGVPIDRDIDEYENELIRKGAGTE